MLDSTELIRDLIRIPGPPGEEAAVRDSVEHRVRDLGYSPTIDAKGNVLVHLRGASDSAANVLVTAHMDEIAMMVKSIDMDGKIRVAPSGGAYPWKWGEGPVDIMTRDGTLPSILSFGCIHTSSPESVAEQTRATPLTWDRPYLFTGLTFKELESRGVRPGIRAVLGAARRQLVEFGAYVASYFIDDRADLAVWLMALERLAAKPISNVNLTFAATVSEEVGGNGALYVLRSNPADICVALEIGPRTPEADFSIDAQPTIWVNDSYSAMEAIDGHILTDCAERLGQSPHWQFLSRGGSDASCAGARGLIARAVTLGLPVENSHGYEIMRRDAPEQLTRLLLDYVQAVGN